VGPAGRRPALDLCKEGLNRSGIKRPSRTRRRWGIGSGQAGEPSGGLRAPGGAVLVAAQVEVPNGCGSAAHAVGIRRGGPHRPSAPGADQPRCSAAGGHERACWGVNQNQSPQAGPQAMKPRSSWPLVMPTKTGLAPQWTHSV
jgi:hypothetical protein